MPAPCIEVAMDTFGGMSGGPVVNDSGNVIGVVSSSFDGGPSYVTLLWDVMRHSINLTAPWLQRGKVSLLSLQDLGLVKLKGNVKRSRFGNVVMSFTAEESKQLIDAVGPARISPTNIALDDEQLDTFMDDHSRDIDEALSQAAIDYLSSVPVSTACSFLRSNEVPDTCLESISSFDVEDFEGIEDLSLISNTRIEEADILFICEFELRTVIWTVSVPTSVYVANTTSFDAYFMNAKAGVDGVICVDIPSEEDPELGPALRAAGVDLIRLATPTTDAARLPDVLNGAGGFLYYVSVAGITGMQQAAQASIEDAVARLKAATDLPVAVGFGVRTPMQAADIAKVADGVVVGSAFIDIIAEHGDAAAPHVEAFTRSLADAIHGAKEIAA